MRYRSCNRLSLRLQVKQIATRSTTESDESDLKEKRTWEQGRSRTPEYAAAARAVIIIITHKQAKKQISTGAAGTPAGTIAHRGRQQELRAAALLAVLVELGRHITQVLRLPAHGTHIEETEAIRIRDNR